MADSEQESVDYGAEQGSGANRAQFFLRRVVPTLLAIALVALFINLGQWQWHKAERKAARQEQRDTRSSNTLDVAGAPMTAESLRDYHVRALGEYQPAEQIFLDNRVYREQAGYHVLTPLKLQGSEMRILVNRGWIPALADHSRTPVVDTPPGMVSVTGIAVIPSTRFFSLAPEPVGTGWKSVWQNLDLAAYAALSHHPLQPAVIQLDPDSSAGGFAREWPRPDDRREMHLSYALQWWGFAAATVAIWLFVQFRRQ